MSANPQAALDALRSGSVVRYENELGALRRANVERLKDYPDCAPWDEFEWAAAMGGEAGEAINVGKKIRRARAAGKSDAELRAALGKEIADVIIYADLLAHVLGVDLWSLIEQKFNEVSERVGSDVRL